MWVAETIDRMGRDQPCQDNPAETQKAAKKTAKKAAKKKEPKAEKAEVPAEEKSGNKE